MCDATGKSSTRRSLLRRAIGYGTALVAAPSAGRAFVTAIAAPRRLTDSPRSRPNGLQDDVPTPTLPDLSFWTQTIPPATHYVDPNGSDDHSGKEDAPWRTIGKALQTLT